MQTDRVNGVDVAKAAHGRAKPFDALAFEAALAEALGTGYGPHGLADSYSRFSAGEGMNDVLMRGAIRTALAGRCGPGLKVGSGTGFEHDIRYRRRRVHRRARPCTGRTRQKL